MMDGATATNGMSANSRCPERPEPSAQNGSARFGLGGQRLFVFPELEFVLAVTAGNYVTEDQGRAPIAILREGFLAGLVD